MKVLTVDSNSRSRRLLSAAHVVIVALFATSCGDTPSANPDPVAVTATQSPVGRSAKSALPAPATLGDDADGMCAPASPQSCGEWCAEHGTLEADCEPCKKAAAAGQH